MSARASCSRMRQPPEKLLTGWLSCAALKPRPRISAWARAGGIVCTGVVQLHVGVRHAHAIVAGLGGGYFGLRGQQHGVTFDYEVGRALLGLRHVLRDLAHLPCSGNRELAAVFVQRAVEKAEEGRLAGAIAADKANLFAGGEGDGRAVEYDIDAAAQRDIMEEIMGGTSKRTRMIADRRRRHLGKFQPLRAAAITA